MSRFVSALLAILFTVGAARADFVATYEVGEGDSTSYLQFEFTNGNAYLYTIHWSGSATGRDLFDIVAGAQPGWFAFETQDFPFGEALFAVTIGADFDAGLGTPPDFFDYWHYWVRDDAREDWGYASTGFGDRVLFDGSWDGWVFGSHAPPIPAAPTVIALVTILGMKRRRR